MQKKPPPSPSPRPTLPRCLLDDAWWLAAALVDRPPVRVVPAPPRAGEAPR